MRWYLSNPGFTTRSVPKRVHRRLWSFFGTERIKVGTVPTVFFPFQRSPSFRYRSASLFPEPVLLLLQVFTVNRVRLTPYNLRQNGRKVLKNSKRNRERLKSQRTNRLNFRNTTRLICCIWRSRSDRMH